jgi:hypothetical protein
VNEASEIQEEACFAAGVIRGDQFVIRLITRSEPRNIIVRTTGASPSESRQTFTRAPKADGAFDEQLAKLVESKRELRRARIWEARVPRASSDIIESCLVSGASAERPIPWLDTRVALDCLCPSDKEAFWQRLSHHKKRPLDIETLRFVAVQTWRDEAAEMPFRITALVVVLYKSVELEARAPDPMLNAGISQALEAAPKIGKGASVRTDGRQLMVSLHLAALHYYVFTRQHREAEQTIAALVSLESEFWARRATLAYNLAKAMLLHAMDLYHAQKQAESREAFMKLHELFYASTRKVIASATVFRDLHTVHEAAWHGLRAVEAMDAGQALDVPLLKAMRRTASRVLTAPYDAAMMEYLQRPRTP